MSAETPTGEDPLAACTPEEKATYAAMPAAARKAISQSTANTIRDTQAAEKAAFMKRVTVETPDLKPARLARLRALPVAAARLVHEGIVAGLADAPKVTAPPVAPVAKIQVAPADRRAPETPSAGGNVPEIILFAGETKIEPAVNAMRHAQLARFGGDIKALERASLFGGA